jgi:formate dehydrogenase iron-sulfur subunit
MDSLSRRKFLKKGAEAAVGVGAANVVTGVAMAATPVRSSEELNEEASGHYALLFDSTLCIGCRSCELACEAENALGRTKDEIFQGRDANDARALAPDVYTYVTFHQLEADPSTAAFGKVQCMHCIEPACVSSCPVGALEKTEEGPVVWREDLCLGCRYCMMACPFLVPRFEWDSRNPRIRKCDMCYERLLEGKSPACVASCPTGAMKFGKRDDLLSEAYRRIADRPRKYVHHVYGEHEAGGTDFLHLASRPFDELGYRRDLPTRSYRDYTRPAMATIPYIMSGLAAMLGAVAWVVNRREQVEVGEERRD